SGSFPAHIGGENIAAAPNGLDDFRVARVTLDLLAQAAHLRVHAAVERVGRAMARKIQQLVAAQGALRVLDQRQQQVEFAGAQRYGDPIFAQQFPPVDIERPAVKTIELWRLACSSSFSFFVSERWINSGAWYLLASARAALSVAGGNIVERRGGGGGGAPTARWPAG